VSFGCVVCKEAAMLRRSSGVPLALLAALLAACTAGSPAAWQNPTDRSGPSMSDTSDCRAQARRQAELRYPDEPIAPRTTRDPLYRQQNPDRFPSEVRLFELCMERKGFARVAAQPR
jgi:hypothetical protein